MLKNHPRMPAKKAPSKKAAWKKTVARMAAPRKTASRKTVAKRMTAVDAVLAAIGRSKKGVGTATVMKKTRFDKQKLYNIVSRLKKQGKIRVAGRGMYVKA